MRAAFSFRAWRRRPLLIASALLAAALLVFFAGPRARVSASITPQAAPHSSMHVVVASHRLAAGTIIAPGDFRISTIRGAVPAGALLSEDGALGHIAIKGFESGDVLLEDSLRDPSEVGIAARVSAGERAYSIRIAEDEIVGGFLQSGNHVDIIATIPGSAFAARDAQNLADRSQTVLLLQNVLVLAVGENSATKGSVQAAARTVSLSLPPKELARLALAVRFGKVSLAIRRPGDATVSENTSATLADLVRLPTGNASDHVVRHSAGIPFYAGSRATVAKWGNAP
jgi:pilus assembly protein CpaB